MSFFIDSLRSMTPHALIERHRRNFQMGCLSLPGSKAVADAVATCRFDLWPLELRKPAKPWLLLDVGANTGEFSRAVSSLIPLAGVYAFEPQPSCQESLKNVLENIPGSHLHSVAVGSSAGEIDLLCTANSKMASVLTPAAAVTHEYCKGDFHVQQHLKVPLVRLDDVIPECAPVGLLKIDVQGYELPVLEGARQTLRRTSALLMEVNYVPHYEGGAIFDNLLEVIRSHGFRTFGISAPYCGANGPLWADALFVREH